MPREFVSFTWGGGLHTKMPINIFTVSRSNPVHMLLLLFFVKKKKKGITCPISYMIVYLPLDVTVGLSDVPFTSAV